MSALGYHEVALVERFIAGADVAVSIVAGQTLPAVEIEATRGGYDYQARYETGGTLWHVPARLDTAAEARTREVALAAHEALELGDMSRIDMIVTPEGEPYLLEATVTPGTTDTSLLPLAVAACELELATLLSELVEAAITRAERPTSVSRRGTPSPRA
jgi:D-alanine-D-alanine ligase